MSAIGRPSNDGQLGWIAAVDWGVSKNCVGGGQILRFGIVPDGRGQTVVPKGLRFEVSLGEPFDVCGCKRSVEADEGEQGPCPLPQTLRHSPGLAGCGVAEGAQDLTLAEPWAQIVGDVRRDRIVCPLRWRLVRGKA